MTEKTRLTRKKLFNYFLNSLLVVIVLILLIPGWRISFQGWFQGLFMGAVDFETRSELVLPAEAQNWALFNMESELTRFGDLGDKPVILSFWATWCPPCRAELPELKALQDHYGNQLHVIAVSEETIEIIRNSGLHEDYAFLYSTTGIPAFFEVTSYPTLLVLDDGMKMVFRNEGAAHINTEKNRQFLDRLIRE